MPNNIVILVLDSCRFDSFSRADTPNFDRVGGVQNRWSYASWTAPSHHALLMGLTPHRSSPFVYASETYKQDFSDWKERLGLERIEFETFLPHLSLPKVLKDLNYKCIARVSMPVLNAFTLTNNFFDDYKLMQSHNDFVGMVDELDFDTGQPTLYFLNLGETHYPYMLSGENLPYIPGVHGAARALAAGDDGGGFVQDTVAMSSEEFFESKTMARLHDQQVRCVEYVDKIFGQLIDVASPDTYYVVLADHGELFGEEGYFGHGPIMHEKVFEVPFLEGRIS